MNKFYVYVYCDPRKHYDITISGHIFKNQPIYIGYGSGDRINYHLGIRTYDKNMVKKNKIKAIRAAGLEPIVYKIREGLSRKEAGDTEKIFISTIGTILELPGVPPGPLTNLTLGGDGGSTLLGRRLSEEWKHNISKGNTGKVFSKERIRHISEAQKKRNPPITKIQRKEMINGLKNMSSEARQRIIEATSGKIWINNGIFHKRVKPEDVKQHLASGWIIGFLGGGKKLTSVSDNDSIIDK